MRLSVRQSDSGFANYCAIISRLKKVLIKFNGELQTLCITADDEAGMIVRMAQPVAWDRNRAQFVDEVLHGRVEIEIVAATVL